MEKFGWLEGTKYLGEWSVETNQPHGRGILILNDKQIEIGQYNNGHHAPGNFLFFENENFVQVGERYLQKAYRWLKGVTYNLKDHSSKKMLCQEKYFIAS